MLMANPISTQSQLPEYIDCVQKLSCGNYNRCMEWLSFKCDAKKIQISESKLQI